MDISKIKKASITCYIKAKENAEDMLVRDLTKDECMILLLGMEYGKLEGYGEGRYDAGQDMKRTLLRVQDKMRNL